MYAIVHVGCCRCMLFRIKNHGVDLSASSLCHQKVFVKADPLAMMHAVDLNFRNESQAKKANLAPGSE